MSCLKLFLKYNHSENLKHLCSFLNLIIFLFFLKKEEKQQQKQNKLLHNRKYLNMFLLIEVTKKFKNSPIDKTIDIVFKNHVNFFLHLLLYYYYKGIKRYH